MIINTLYLNRLAHVGAFIEDLDTTSVYIIEELNADVYDNHSLFSAHMHSLW